MTKRTAAAGKTAVAEVKQVGLPAQYDFGDDAGGGFEGQDSSYLSIPFINVLQALSPQVKSPKQGGIEGAEVGMLFNSVTQDLYPDGFEFVPAHVEHVFVEWVPRDKGGGFVAVHKPDSDAVVSAKERSTDRKLKTPDGNDLIETFYVYGVMAEGENVLGMAVIAFTSTKIKVFRGWNTKINMFAHKKYGIPVKPPLWAHRVRISTRMQKNNKGEFANFVIDPAVENDVFKSLVDPRSELYATAKQVREMVLGGQARAAYETQASAGGDNEEAGGDGEVPF